VYLQYCHFRVVCSFYLEVVFFFFLFDMFAQEGEGRFELVTSASLGVVLTD
jgi:hypothetical protein